MCASRSLLLVTLLHSLAEFYGLDERVILAALRTLEKRGKAAIIPGDAPGETGVKFLP